MKIKGLGTFRLSRVEPRKSVDVTTGQPMEISGHSKVVFIPAKEIADAVNAPFEAFSSIEIDDDTDIEQLLSKDEVISDRVDDEIEDSEEEAEENFKVLETADDSAEIAETDQQAMTAEVADIAETTEVAETAETREMDEAYDNTDNPESAETSEVAENTEEEDDEDFEDYDEPVISRKRNWVKGVLISFAAAIIALVATFAVWYIFATNDFNKRFNKETPSMAKGPVEGFTVGKPLDISTEETPDDPTAIVETNDADDNKTVEEDATKDIEEVPTAPSDAVVYDTISTTRYLTTMAKKHYGNYNLWPYIYEENKAKLGHPDRIRPGTPVVIPKLSKYGVDPNNASDIDKAKKMGIAIYSKYGKKI